MANVRHRIGESLQPSIDHSAKNHYEFLRSLPGRLKRAAKTFRSSSEGSLDVMEVECLNSFTIAYRRHTLDKCMIKESIESDLFFAGVPEYVPSPRHTN